MKFCWDNLVAAKSQEAFFTSWTVFQEKFPQSVAYVQSMVDAKDHFCRPWTRNLFSLDLRANLGECMNSSFTGSVSDALAPLELLMHTLHYCSRFSEGEILRNSKYAVGFTMSSGNPILDKHSTDYTNACFTKMARNWQKSTMYREVYVEEVWYKVEHKTLSSGVVECRDVRFVDGLWNCSVKTGGCGWTDANGQGPCKHLIPVLVRLHIDPFGREYVRTRYLRAPNVLGYPRPGMDLVPFTMVKNSVFDNTRPLIGVSDTPHTWMESDETHHVEEHKDIAQENVLGIPPTRVKTADARYNECLGLGRNLAGLVQQFSTQHEVVCTVLKYLADALRGRRSMSSGALSTVLETLTPIQPPENVQRVPSVPVGLPQGSVADTVPQFPKMHLKGGRVKGRKQSSRERSSGTQSKRSCRQCGEKTHTDKGTCVHIRAVGDVMKTLMWSRLGDADVVTLDSEASGIPSRAKILIVVARSSDGTKFLCVPHQNILLPCITPATCVSAQTMEEWCKKGESRSKIVVLGSKEYVTSFHDSGSITPNVSTPVCLSDDDDLGDDQVEVRPTESRLPTDYVVPESSYIPDKDDDSGFADLFQDLAEQEAAFASYVPPADKPHVEPRLQEGHTKRRVRKPKKNDDDWDAPGVAKRRKSSSAPKVDHWHDCLDCGKWRKLQRAAVSNRRFVCANVGVDCDDECDCDEACDC